MRAPNAILIACLQPWPNRGQRACDRQRSILQQPQRTVGCNCGYESNSYHESNLSLDYVMHLGYKIGQPRSLRACSRDDPECGARRGVLRQRPVTVRPWRLGTPALQALRPGCEELAVTEPAQMPVRQARTRSPKSPRWSAERRASRVMGRKAPRKRLACRVMCTPNGCRCTRTTLGAPPTLIRGERSKVANLGRGKRAAGTRWAV